jgi:F-type H+-transporting ATPase subunit b
MKARLDRMALLALVVLTLAVPTPRLAAQQPAPAGQDAASSTPAQEAAQEEKEEGENVYRHSALVKSTARVLHLQVETTARILEGINFAVVVLAIGIPLFRFLPKYLRGRGEKLSSDLESARKMTEDAKSRLSAVEARLAQLDSEIAGFRAQVDADMRADDARIQAGLEEERARIVASAGQEIAVAAAQARRELRNFAAELAVGQAARQIVLTPETDRALIAEFIAGAGRGGQN